MLLLADLHDAKKYSSPPRRRRSTDDWARGPGSGNGLRRYEALSSTDSRFVVGGSAGANARADAAEKVTRKHSELLQLHKKELLGLMSEVSEQELRWHLAVMVPRLPLNARERQAAISSLNGYLEDRSSIVKTFALQGLADLAEAEPSFRGKVIEILAEAARNGTPAMKARSRKLLLRLDRI